jgi:hypothetical protein
MDSFGIASTSRVRRICPLDDDDLPAVSEMQHKVGNCYCHHCNCNNHQCPGKTIKMWNITPNKSIYHNTFK